MKCEICDKVFDDAFCDKHHIQSKCKGGSNHKSNKAVLCKKHHLMVHRGLLVIEGRFNSTDGDVLVWRKYTDESITGMPDPDVYIIERKQK